jgi:hypothetical protein
VVYGDVRILVVRCMMSGVLILVMVSGKWCLQYCMVNIETGLGLTELAALCCYGVA